ncbi:MAG: D-alanyl-D-alanine carboxypeptidase/D-alanyl-D-alanine-endopeptidase [Bacteroidetes bacterium]|nr:D-alanyl-D-alanine carboxypeptidase/D-alanyl-D-alanine-endopeptidase [Bacteroidota bacterium]
MKLKNALIIFLTFSSLIFSQGTSSNVVTKLEGVLSNKFFTSTSTALEIYNLSENKLIYSKNAGLLLRPASTLKILTSLTALYYLDEAYTFDTKIYYTGKIINSVLYGDLFVVGGGDPEFDLESLSLLATKISDSGIKKITGNLYGDVSMCDSLFWGNGWMWDDDPYAFTPYLSPLILNKSVSEIHYSPGEIGSPVEVSVTPQSKFFNILNTSTTIAEDTSDFHVTRDWLNRSNELLVSGTLSRKAKSDTVYRNIFAPQNFFLQVFSEYLDSTGINFSGIIDTLEVPDSGATPLLIFSQPLDTVLFYMNKESDNLNAEMVLRALAKKRNEKRVSAKDGMISLDSLITKVGLNPKTYKIADGSGLSFYNLITAELLSEVLRYTYYHYPDIYYRLINTLPIAGIDGTLKDRLKKNGCYNNLKGKTGTISGVSCLTGTLKSSSGDDILFTIMMQNYVASARIARTLQDKICRILYDEL